MSLAVIKTGGKQYLVTAGKKLKVEKLNAQEGETVELPVLLASDESGANLQLGKPFLAAKAKAKVLKQDRAKKILVVKFQAKTRTRKRVGHRQPFTEVQMEKI